MSALVDYTLHLADTNLVLGQRIAEWCGHSFILEQDIAKSNIALDLIGQSRSLYQYAAQLVGEGKTEDDLAFLRSDREYKNLLIVEQPNGDFASTLARQFYFDAFHVLQCEKLLASHDETLRAIAEKAVKEARYHHTWSAEWVIRLGDGTAESHRRIQLALEDLWMWTGEFFMPASYETELVSRGIAVNLAELKLPWEAKIREVLQEATLAMPVGEALQRGGKTGAHTEYLGHLLAEMQVLPRTYPGATW